MTGAELRKWRERHDWSQDRLAEALELPRNTIARWERGELEIRHGKLLELALWALTQRMKK